MITIDSNQILVPKQVYIGDKAELRCTFNFDSPELAAAVKENGQFSLSAGYFKDVLDFSKYEIKEVQLAPAGVNYYSVIVTFIPWQTGELVLPSYDIGVALGAEPDTLVLAFKPVNIVSLVEQNSVTGIRSSEAPKLLPGTIYRLYGALLGAVLLIVLSIRLIIKRKDVAFFIKNRKLLRKYRKNQKGAVKALNSLLKQPDMSDHETAEKIQAIMRKYLEVRFDYPFTHKVASQIVPGLIEATLGNIYETEEKEEACGLLCAAFVRTDYIRYSANASFREGERVSLINQLVEIIAAFEKQESQKEEDDVRVQ